MYEIREKVNTLKTILPVVTKTDIAANVVMTTHDTENDWLKKEKNDIFFIQFEDVPKLNDF